MGIINYAFEWQKHMVRCSSPWMWNTFSSYKRSYHSLYVKIHVMGRVFTKSFNSYVFNWCGNMLPFCTLPIRNRCIFYQYKGTWWSLQYITASFTTWGDATYKIARAFKMHISLASNGIRVPLDSPCLVYRHFCNASGGYNGQQNLCFAIGAQSGR